MELDKILEIFSDSARFHTLNYGEKMIGVIITIIIGMGITFCGLIIILSILQIITKIVATTETEKISKENLEVDSQDEIVAAITSSIISMKYTENNFAIKSIKKIK